MTIEEFISDFQAMDVDTLNRALEIQLDILATLRQRNNNRAAWIRQSARVNALRKLIASK